MDWRLKLLIILSAFVFSAESISAEFLYKTVDLSKHCSFSIPFLWKVKEVAVNIPKEIKSITETYKSLELIGKEVMVSATVVKYKGNVNIDSAIANTVQQFRSMLPNITDFVYSYAPFSIMGGMARMCRISYKSSRGVYVQNKMLIIVPISDLSTIYNFTGLYGKVHKHSEEVVDKIYRSIKLQ